MKGSIKTAIAAGAALALPLLALAQGGIVPVTPPATINIQTTINFIIGWLFGLLLIVITLWIFYAAFLYLTAAGDPTKAATATRYILFGFVALAVAFASRGLVTIVKGVLGLP